jgi:uncharacterized damage-inducible protein DinB
VPFLQKLHFRNVAKQSLKKFASASCSVYNDTFSAGVKLMTAELIDRFVADATIYQLDLLGLSEADFDARPVANQWTIRELVWHVVDSDIILADRMRRIVAEDNPPLTAFDENAFVQRLFYDQRALEPAVKLFEVNRLAMTDILRRLQPSDFERCGIHSEVGPISLFELLRKTVAHPLHHRKFLLEKRRLLGKPLPA